MKKITLIFTLVLSVVTTSFAGINPELRKEISEKIIVDLSKVELSEDQSDFVSITFSIYDGEIVIHNINGTQSELNDIMINELNSMRISSDYEEGKKYEYRFTFKKQ